MKTEESTGNPPYSIPPYSSHMRQRGEAYAGEDHRRPGPRSPSTAPIMVRFVEVVDFGLLTMDQVAAQLNPIARQWDEADGLPLPA